MAFTFDPIFAADPSNTTNVATNAAITIYNPADPGKAPVTITDVSGSPLPNPITVNKNGFGPAFQHATLDRLAWSGGGFTGYFTSYEGIKAEAVAARAAAETAGANAAAEASAALNGAVADADAAKVSADAAAEAADASATAAANSAALVNAPADTAIATAINTNGSATKAALSTAFSSKVVELGRFPAFAPKLPALITADAPTITYTDHTAAAPFATLVLPTDPRLTFHGWVAGTRNISGNSTWINLANGYLGSKDYATATEVGTYAPYDIEFDYYGTGLALNTIGLQATYKWQVYVDGLPVSASPLSMDSTKTGNAYGQFASLTWGSAKLRRIRLRLPDNIALKGIRVSNADSLSPAKKSAARAFVLGDSWTAAQGADASFTGYAFQLGLLTGWEIYRGGQGGTGYVNQGASNASEFGSLARRNPIKDVQPEYLIVAGTSNDDANSATVGAAATALYNAVATDSPKTKIIVIGPQNTTTSVSANREAVRAAIISAANAAPNVIGVIDPITAGWITGTGKAGAPANNGNADVFVGSDGAHLTQAGYDYWARRILAALPAAAV